MESIIDFLLFRLFEREDFIALSIVDVQGDVQARCYRRARRLSIFSHSSHCLAGGTPPPAREDIVCHQDIVGLCRSTWR